MDGYELIVEGMRGGRYHVVDRSPPDPAYESLGRYMLELTNIDISAQKEDGPESSADDPG